ncbi:MAG: POTRA domain-containing protein, partial [Bdellovibrionota bacterium]
MRLSSVFYFGVSVFLALGSVAGTRAHSAPGEDVSRWEGKVVASVEPAGMVRIEKEAILAKVETKPGQPLLGGRVKADIQALFAMGFFDEVEVKVDDAPEGKVKVFYRVKERPVIASLDFEGNDKISADDLKEVIRTKQWSILDLNRVKEDISLLQKHYEEKGYYLAKVTYEVRPSKTKPDEIDLIYSVSDYNKVQIK